MAVVEQWSKTVHINSKRSDDKRHY